MPEKKLTPQEIGGLLEDAGIQQQSERNRQAAQEKTEKSLMKKILRWFR